MDESGIHAGSLAVTVGAYVGRPSVWQDFTKAWKRRKRPISIFHAADCANLRGEFKGWTPEDRDRYVAKLFPVIPQHRLAGVVIGIHVPAFEEAMAAVPEVRSIFRTPYDGCFQWCVQRIVDYHNAAHATQRLVFFHEINDFQAECKRTFGELNRAPKNTSHSMTLSFVGKSDHIPLQAADVLAYESNKIMRNISKATLRRSWLAINPHLDRVHFQYFGEENRDHMIRLMIRSHRRLLTSA